MNINSSIFKYIHNPLSVLFMSLILWHVVIYLTACGDVKPSPNIIYNFSWSLIFWKLGIIMFIFLKNSSLSLL